MSACEYIEIRVVEVELKRSDGANAWVFADLHADWLIGRDRVVLANVWWS